MSRNKIALGIDLATTLSARNIADFKNLGVKFVGRYVKSNSWKSLNSSEAKLITGYGLQILSVFERTADRTKGGASAGRVDGIEARIHCMGLGQPSGSAIYFAVDYDAPPSQYDNIEAYLKAAQVEIGEYRLGVYGSYAVVEEMAKRFPGIYVWQTLAWSKGRISDKAHVFQRQIDIKVAGVNIDWNDMYAEAGLWGGTPVVAKPVDNPSAPVADVDIPIKVTMTLKNKNGSEKAIGYLIDNRSYVALADLAKVFGFTKGWDNETKVATINGRDVTHGKLIKNETFVRADVVANAFQGTLKWNNERKELSIIGGATK